MINNKKCIEYYLDSRIYDKEELQKNIEEAKKEFPKKEIEVQVELNDWGVYIVTLFLEDKKKKKEKTSYIIERKKQKEDKQQKYYGAKKYGQYKQTRTYRPY